MSTQRATKWGYMIEAVRDLDVGDSAFVEIPADCKPDHARSNMRGILSANHATSRNRWSLELAPENQVKITKREPFPPAWERDAADKAKTPTQEADSSLLREIIEAADTAREHGLIIPDDPIEPPDAPEIAATTVEEQPEVVPSLECGPEEELTPAPQVAEAAEAPSSLLLSFLTNTPPEAEKLISNSIELWDLDAPEDDVRRDALMDENWELATALGRYRRNKVLTDRALSAWLERSGLIPVLDLYCTGDESDGKPETFKDLWRTVHGLLAEVERATWERAKARIARGEKL